MKNLAGVLVIVVATVCSTSNVGAQIQIDWAPPFQYHYQPGDSEELQQKAREYEALDRVYCDVIRSKLYQPGNVSYSLEERRLEEEHSRAARAYEQAREAQDIANALQKARLEAGVYQPSNMPPQDQAFTSLPYGQPQGQAFVSQSYGQQYDSLAYGQQTRQRKLALLEKIGEYIGGVIFWIIMLVAWFWYQKQKKCAK